MMEIPTDLDDRDLARYYTLTPEELELVNLRRRPVNRFGFAIQLALLHFPGRPLAEYSNQRQVPRPILTSIAGQIHLPISAFAEYGNRPGTLYEHIDEICKECGYRRCGWREYLAAARFLLPHALESDRAVPLIEQAFEFFRKERILPPTLVQTEKLIWIVLRLAEDHLYLEQKQQEIVEKLSLLRKSIGVVPGSLRLDEHGKLQLPSLEKAVPEQAEYHSRRLSTFLPRIPLADLLLEVDNWTGFLRHLTHLSTGMATTGSQRLILVAGLMGMGMNYGLSKVADSCPYSYRQLSWSVDWHIREETLLTALATLDNFVLNLPFARMWGDGTSSSSDGMRIETVVKTPNAVRNARHFGFGKGVTFYSHTADIWMPFGKQQVISTNESEALHVIDARHAS
jgi:TnpA family transposase